MISRLLHRLRGAHAHLGDARLSHPTDEELLCLVDGELSPREAARVRGHVEACWNCRHRRARMQQTIDAFMEACAEVGADERAEEDAAFIGTRLPRAALAALHAPASPRAAMSEAATPPRWRLSGAVAVRLVAACATVWLIVLLSSGGPVSARQLARQVDRAEREALLRATRPVVYQRLDILRRAADAKGVASGAAGPGVDETSAWEIWTDVTQHRRRARRVRDGDGDGDGRWRATSPRGTDAPAATRTADAGTTPRAPSALRASNVADAARASEGGRDEDALPEVIAALLRASDGGDAWPVSLRAHQQWRARQPLARDTVRVATTVDGEPALLLEATVDGREVGVNAGPDAGAADAPMYGLIGGPSGGPNGGLRGAASGVSGDVSAERTADIGQGVGPSPSLSQPQSQLQSPSRTASARGAAPVDPTAAADALPRDADAADAIVRGALLVRERDWHPVEQRLTVRAGVHIEEIIIRESGFQVLPRASLPVAFFEGDVSEPPSLARAAVTPAPAAVPLPADLVTAEVQAMYALHQVGVTAADEIAVHRRARTIEVVGLTTSDERRRAMLAALAPIALVQARIQTADEALAAMTHEADDAASLATPVAATGSRVSATAHAQTALPAPAVAAPGTAVPATAAPAAVASAAPASTVASTAPVATAAVSAALVPADTVPADTVLAAPAAVAPVAAAPVAAAPVSAGPVPAAPVPAAPASAGAAHADGAAAARAPGSASSRATVASPLRFETAEIRADRLPAQALGRSDGGRHDTRADATTLRRAREAVQQSLTLLERAWALRRLAEWARRTNSGDVTPNTRALIDVMLRERTDAASKALATLDATLGAALPSTSAAAAASAAPAAAASASSSGAPASTRDSGDRTNGRPDSRLDGRPDGRADGRADGSSAAEAAVAGARATSAAAPASASAAATATATDDARPWTDVAIDFFGVAAEIDRDTRRLFTASAPDAAADIATPPDEDARRLRRGLASAARFLGALQRTRP